MTSSYKIESKKEFPEIHGLIMCSCEAPAAGRYRGYDYRPANGSSGRPKGPVHRWMCESCAADILDEGGHLRQVEAQSLNSEQEKALDEWAEKYL